MAGDEGEVAELRRQLHQCASLGDALFQENQKLRAELTAQRSSAEHSAAELKAANRKLRSALNKQKSLQDSLANADSEISALSTKLDHAKAELEEANNLAMDRANQGGTDEVARH